MVQCTSLPRPRGGGSHTHADLPILLLNVDFVPAFLELNHLHRCELVIVLVLPYGEEDGEPPTPPGPT
jgi:hypothetical protein